MSQNRARSTKLLAVTLSAVVVFAVIAAGAVFLLVRGGSAKADTPAATKSPLATTRVVGYLGIVRGQFTWSSTDGTCWGINTRKDIKTGAPLLVSNESGRIVAKGALGQGVAQRSEADPAFADWCIFPFDVTAPAGLPIYGVAVEGMTPKVFTKEEITKAIRLDLS